MFKIDFEDINFLKIEDKRYMTIGTDKDEVIIINPRMELFTKDLKPYAKENLTTLEYNTACSVTNLMLNEFEYLKEIL